MSTSKKAPTCTLSELDELKLDFAEWFQMTEADFQRAIAIKRTLAMHEIGRTLNMIQRDLATLASRESASNRPPMSIAEFAEAFGHSEAAVQKHLEELIEGSAKSNDLKELQLRDGAHIPPFLKSRLLNSLRLAKEKQIAGLKRGKGSQKPSRRA